MQIMRPEKGDSMLPSKAFARQMEGYGLTRAQVFFYLPDHPHVLQWMFTEEFDIWPQFPYFRRTFVEFWKREIEGPLHSIRIISHTRLIKPVEIPVVSTELKFR